MFDKSPYEIFMSIVGIGVLILVIVNLTLYIYKKFLQKKKPKDFTNVPYTDWPWMGSIQYDDYKLIGLIGIKGKAMSNS
jgi:hypothetical protein